MKIKSFSQVVGILALGAVFTWLILDIQPSSRAPEHLQTEENDSPPRGRHGGWLFSEEDLNLEVKIFEKGVPPQFRVYGSDRSGKPVDPGELQVSIELHRLDRVDVIGFKPSGDYLLGDHVVSEPHSFDVKIKARWKTRSYQWEISQIEARARFSEEAIKNAGIGIAAAGPAKIKKVLRLTGEIGFNEEKVVHIVPRLEGVIKKVFKDLGDRVTVGELLAILESRELADAKTRYLEITQTANLALLDLDRETLIYENTQSMLDLLEQELVPEEIYPQLKDLILGESRELLIPAYAKLQLARSVHKREKNLFNKGISSESEYLLALEGFKSAEARYIALREKIAYDGPWTLRQKKRAAEMEQLNLQTNTQKLLALGLTPEELDALTSRPERDFTQFDMKSPINGIVIQKHLTTGEAVKKDDDVYLISDLSEVWVNIAIPARDMKSVRTGQVVHVRDENLGMAAEGKLTYLGSIVEEKTRTVTGRAVIANAERHWRPGAFVTVELVLSERRVPLAVPAESIQTLRDWSVVFVKVGDLLEARPLELGENDGHWIEVLQGLSAGEHYVAQNSFVVKAEIEKSSAVHDH